MKHQEKHYQVRYEAIIRDDSDHSPSGLSASGIYRRTYRAAYQDAVEGGNGDMSGCVQQTNTVGGEVHRLYAQCDIDAAIRHDARLRKQRRA